MDPRLRGEKKGTGSPPTRGKKQKNISKKQKNSYESKQKKDSLSYLARIPFFGILTPQYNKNKGMPFLDGIQSKKNTNFSQKKRKKSIFSFFSFPSFLKRYPFLFSGISLIFLFSFLTLSSLFLSSQIEGATYRWNQTSWLQESTDMVEHPAPSDWNKYVSKDNQILLGDSLTLTSQPQTLLQTTDTHFSEGTKTDLGILGSGDDASLGLLSALGAVAQVSAGSEHTCALKTDGTVWCWGRNNNNGGGQLGDNTNTDRLTPVQVLGVGGSGFLSDILHISAGYDHTCATKTDGTVYCWGNNGSGQLGDNTTINRYVPVQVLGVGGSGFLSGVSQLAGREYHTCALKTDGTVWCWGFSSNGQLGDNTTISKYTPVQVLGVGASGFLEGVSQISVGLSHTCATKTDGTVWCWGSNSDGKLGDNTTTQRLTPVQVKGVDGSGILSGVSQITSGQQSNCVLKTDGTVWCWGANNYSVLGDNTTTNRYTPVQVLGVGASGFLSGVQEIKMKNWSSCALKTDGMVYCWGVNTNGQLGDNTTTNRSTPVQVLGVGGSGFLSGVSQISLGQNHICTLSTTNTVFCWGVNSRGQLGDNTNTQRRTPVATLDETSTFLSFTQNTIQVVNGSSHSCMLKEDFTVWCWGLNGSYGRLGRGENTTSNMRIPVQVKGVDGIGFLENVAQISVGSDHTCATKTDGTAYCWGYNYYGQLGDNTTINRYTPVQVLGVNASGFLEGISKISVGSLHTCALKKTDGTVWCWGSNSSGQLGDNTTTQRLTPVQVKGVGNSGFLENVSQISVGNSYACATKIDGTTYCWGSNGSGKLGDNTTTQRNTPVQVKNAGATFLDPLSQSQKVTVSGPFNTATASSCTLREDSTVWCWGDNQYGQLGDGSTEIRPGAVQVKDVGGVGYLSDIVEITQGGSHACALKTDGTVWCWGRGNSGRLGDNTSIDRYTPVQVKGVGNVGFLGEISQISAGSSHTCATKTDGTAYCWGFNSNGQLGDNTTSTRSTPVQVKGVGNSGFLENVSQVSIGDAYTCATKTDGTAYCWGSNGNGRLGDNTTTQRLAPVQVLGVGGSGYLEGVSQISTGNAHACAIKTNGTAYCWGLNSSGQLGDNTTTQTLVPVQVVGVGGSGFLEGILQISAGGSYTCSLKTDGIVYCWGSNFNGKIGDNTITQRNTPVQVLGVGGVGFLQNVLQISAGNQHTCVVKGTGETLCWGNNSSGQLGADTGDTRTPVEVFTYLPSVGFLENISHISAGSVSACAIKTDGTAYCWGFNDRGHIGDNTRIQRFAPVQVLGVGGIGYLEGVLQISLGDYNTCATKIDGTAYCWGWNDSGGLGDNTTTTRLTPIQVLGIGGVGFLESVSQISVGDFYTCSLKTDGTTYCWGSNSNGQLADNTYTNSSTPVQTQLWTFPQGPFFLGERQTALTGTYTSPVFDLTKPVVFTDTSFTHTLNNQNISVDITAGNTPTPDGSWISLENVSDTTDISSLSGKRYFQYRVHLTSDTLGTTPFFNDLTLGYAVFPSSQSLLSSPFDSKDAGNVPGGMVWKENETLPEGSDIAFSLRTASTQEDLSLASFSPPLTSSNSHCTKQDSEVTCTNEAFPESLRDGEGDRFMQYRVTLISQGDTTPKVEEAELIYVVNAPPIVQNVTATPTQEKTVEITYQTKDPDTTSGTNTPGFITPSFEYYNGSSWQAIEPQALREQDLQNKAVTQDDFQTYSALWTPSLSNNDLYLAGSAKVRVTVRDNEGASNSATQESNLFTLDTKIPTNLSLTIDASTQNLSVSSTNSTITLGALDDSSMQMKISLDENLTDASWETFSATKTIKLQTDPDTVYVQFKDQYGNTTQIIHTQTPETPTRVISQDTSNMLLTPPEYRAFIGFKTVALSPQGFGSYRAYRSEDGETYSLLNTVFTRENNYFSDNQVQGDILYYYQIKTTDQQGNISFLSQPVTLRANGVQDAGEGGGGTDRTLPLLANVAIESIETTSATITWHTDKLSTSLVEYGTTPGTYTKQMGVGTYADTPDQSGIHRVTITNLTPDTPYYVRVSSTDPLGNIGINDNDGLGFTFTTHPGPAISDVGVSSASNTQATIVWNTNVPANSLVSFAKEKEMSNLVDPIVISGTSVLSQSHRLTLEGLEQATKYYFKVTSTDSQGNTANNNNGGNYFEFTTTSDTQPPEISSLAIPLLSHERAIITWNTDEASSSFLRFQKKGDTQESQTQQGATYDYAHFIVLTNLIPSTTYSFTPLSKDINGNEREGETQTFQTLVDPEFDHPPLEKIQNISDPPHILTDQKAVITFTTDQIASCMLEYGNQSQTYTEIPVAEKKDSFQKEHSLHISGLIFNTQYFYRILCQDNLDTVVESKEYTFQTKLKQVDSGSEGAETTPPTLSSIQVKEITGESAVVSWETDEVANSLVQYGSTEEMENLAGDSTSSRELINYTTSHSVILRGLIPSTKYFYSVLSSDTSGNIATSPQQEFTTLSPSSISSIRATSKQIGQTTITWNTSTPTTSIVEYGSTQAYGQIRKSEDLTQNHEIILNNLSQNATYHFRVKGEDKQGNLFASSDSTFEPKSPPQIREANIEVLSDKEVQISFFTDTLTDALITYQNQDNEEDQKSQGNPSLTQTHSLTLKDLTPGATYQATIQTRDDSGNETTQDLPPFTLQKDTNPPEIGHVRTDSALSQNGKVQMIFAWETDEPSLCTLIYKEGREGEEKTLNINSVSSKNHVAVLTTFKPGTMYSYQVTAKDASDNIGKSKEYITRTPQVKENVIELILKNFRDIFGWVK